MCLSHWATSEVKIVVILFRKSATNVPSLRSLKKIIFVFDPSDRWHRRIFLKIPRIQEHRTAKQFSRIRMTPQTTQTLVRLKRSSPLQNLHTRRQEADTQQPKPGPHLSNMWYWTDIVIIEPPPPPPRVKRKFKRALHQQLKGRWKIKNLNHCFHFRPTEAVISQIAKNFKFGGKGWAIKICLG